MGKQRHLQVECADTRTQRRPTRTLTRQGTPLAQLWLQRPRPAALRWMPPSSSPVPTPVPAQLQFGCHCQRRGLAHREEEAGPQLTDTEKHGDAVALLSVCTGLPWGPVSRCSPHSPAAAQQSQKEPPSSPGSALLEPFS